MLLARDEPQVDKPTQHCNCSHHGTSDEQRSGDSPSIPEAVFARPGPGQDMKEVGTSMFTEPRPLSSRHSGEPSVIQGQDPGRGSVSDQGGRLTVAAKLKALADYMGTASPERFDISAFRDSRANDFPEIPGEPLRNPQLKQIRDTYNEHREDDDSQSTRSARPRSRAASFNGNTVSGFGIDRDGLTKSRTASPVRPRPSPLVGEGGPSEPPHPASDPTGTRVRRATLKVPSPIPRTPTRLATPTSAMVTVPTDINSPVIVVSDTEAAPSPSGLAISLPDEPESSEGSHITQPRAVGS